MKTKHIYLTCSFLLCLSACQDEEIISAPEDNTQTRAITATSTATSALTSADGGMTWTANQRVPLVGDGRIVDDFSNALIEILSNNQGINNMLDTDITNSASFSSVVTANLIGNQIASVRDVNRTYAGKQNAGFVYLIDNTSLLNVDILKGFWIKTFLKGVEQEMYGSDTQLVQTLQLTLIGAANNGGQQALSITTSLNKPFDEIKIGMYGISADVLKALSLYYAFVGENPIKPAITGSANFPNNVEIHTGPPITLTWTNMLFSDQLIDTNLTNGPSFSLLGSLTQPRVTVNFKQEIPVGSEVGYHLSYAGLLDISLLKTTILTTYDASDVQQEQVTISNLLGISSIVGGGSQISMILKKPCTQVKIQFTGVDASIGATTINYAFVRDPIKVDASSYFSLGNATITGNSYLLKTPTTGSVNYIITSSPAGTSPVISNNTITGMTANGNYNITGTFTSTDGTIYTQTAIITRNASPVGDTSVCNNMITLNTNGASVYAPSGGGCLLCLGEGTNFTGKNNLIDNNPDNFITYNNIASIAANTSIVGIKTATDKPINSAKNQIRTGFVIQTSTNLLSANVLKFMIIRLYRNNVKVFESTADNNNAISVGLIGDNGSKLRIGVTTNQEFDSIELWTGGILNLNLNAFRIYYAFWENANAGCYSGSAANACLQLITPFTYGANINYAATNSTAAVTVGTSFNDLGNLIDSDVNTYSTISATNVLGSVTVAVKFNKIQQKQPVGFIVVDPAGIAGVDLISWITLSVYNAGVEVGRTGTGGILGLNVIGYGGKEFIETTPSTTPFDEVRITFAGVADALKTLQLAGVYTRQDSNGDGIPDCAETTGSGETIDFISVTDHVCQGSPIVINVQGGTNGSNYLLRFYNVAKNNEVTDKTVALTSQSFTIPNMPSGDYYIAIYDATGTNIYYNGIHSTVHPTRTTWKTNAATTNWNTWTNWSDGSPWRCTDVIIPSNCAFYPVLVQGDTNNCRNLHFAPNAEIVNTHYLNYSQAWVELALQSGRYYMLSAPLKDTFTGDMFIPTSMNGTQNNDYFVALDATTSPENRFGPRVYQRLWSHDAPGQKIKGGTLVAVTVTPDNTNWTPPFNALNQNYAMGMGFSLLADRESVSSSTLTFRFPKVHTNYKYFNASGAGTSYNETVTRSLPGRFIHENSSGTTTFPVTVTATNKIAGSTFLVGNPFMTHIRISQFMADNPTVTSVKVYDGNSNNSVIKADGTLLTNGSNFEYIAPMQSFFVTVSVPSTTLPVRFTQTALTQAVGSSGMLRSARAIGSSRSATSGRSALVLTASIGNTSSQCLVRLSPSASVSYRPNEDSELLLDNEMPPVVALFSIADEKALDIQQLNDAEHIPLGFSLRNPARVTLKLSYTGGNAWSRWTLVDTETGKRIPLTQSETVLDAGILSTHVGRFYLEKNK